MPISVDIKRVVLVEAPPPGWFIDLAQRLVAQEFRKSAEAGGAHCPPSQEQWNAALTMMLEHLFYVGVEAALHATTKGATS